MPNQQPIKNLMQRARQIFSNFLKKEEEIQQEAEHLVENKIKQMDEKKIEEVKNKIKNL